MSEPKITQCIDCSATIIKPPRFRGPLPKRCKPCKKTANNLNSKHRYDKTRGLNTCGCGHPRAIGYMRCERCIASQKFTRLARMERGECPACGKPLDGTGKECTQCAARSNNLTRKYNTALRQAILNHYGRECVCCGENIECLLTLDHILNNGGAHRRSLGKGSYKFYKVVIKENYPSLYQILCYNCNIGRYRNGGTCPHKDEARSA